MRLVIQRVLQASVTVDRQLVSSISCGMLVLCGVNRNDSIEDVEWCAQKTARLRIFDDQAGKMNLDLSAIGGEVLVVSQFTLFGDCRKGNRPSYIDAAGPEMGETLYEQFVASLRRQGLVVKTGTFRAMMEVGLVNDGPVTIILDSADNSTRAG